MPFPIRSKLFVDLHGISHPRLKPSLKLFKVCYFYLSFEQDIILWVHKCHQCLASNVHRYTKPPLKQLNCSRNSLKELTLIYLHIFSCFSPSNHFTVYRYLLTFYYRYTKWMEAFTCCHFRKVLFVYFAVVDLQFGLLLYIVTDIVTNVESEFLSELYS